MTYWLFALLVELSSFIEVDCRITKTIQVTVLTASLSSVYSIYILENDTCPSVKSIHFQVLKLSSMAKRSFKIFLQDWARIDSFFFRGMLI